MTRIRIQAKNPSKWRVGVLVGVHIAILAHIAHWLTSGGATIGALEPSEAMELSKHGVVNLGLLVLAGGAVTTAVFGRFFCGWGCHIIALQDLSRWVLAKVGITPRPLRSRLLRWVPYLAFVYMFLWPVVYRLWAKIPAPEVTASLTTTNLWANMPGWVIGGGTLVLVGFASVYVLGAKGFCTYACPYGALMRIAEPLATLRVRVTDACRQCAGCTAACTSNVRVHEQVRDWGMIRDNDCMKCLDCVAACPNDALYLGFGKPGLGARGTSTEKPSGRPWNVGWGEEIFLATAFAASFLVLRGLYGAIPFLMSLGAAGIVAYLMLVAVRLVRRPDVRLSAIRLRRSGRLTSSGRAFLVVMAILVIALGHSAVVRYFEAGAERRFAETSDLRRLAMDLEFQPEGLADHDRVRVKRMLYDLDKARGLGLFSNPRLQLPQAWAFFLSGSVDASMEAVDDAVRLQPGSADVHRLRGRLLIAEGRHREAVLAYAQAVELAPELPEGFLHLGSLLAALGDLERALEVFRRGTVAFPDHADLGFNLGVAHAMMGHTEEAIETFEGVVAVHPEYRRATENLAGTLAGAGRYGDAEALLRRALDAEPRDLAYRLLLARVLLARGDRSAAVAELQTCLETDPGSAEARSFLKQLDTSPSLEE